MEHAFQLAGPACLRLTVAGVYVCMHLDMSYSMLYAAVSLFQSRTNAEIFFVRIPNTYTHRINTNHSNLSGAFFLVRAFPHFFPRSLTLSFDATGPLYVFTVIQFLAMQRNGRTTSENWETAK